MDEKRLNKQIIECQQILDAIDGKSDAWKNHPVTKMYTPYREWLDRYKICLKKYQEGDMDTATWWSNHANLIRPEWMTMTFCDQHKRRLYTKAPTKYPQFEPYGESEENWYIVDGQLKRYIKGKEV
jgi:hypothetical protein